MLKNNEFGFKYLELIIVIFALFFLAAIIAPNYLRARDNAKNAEVKANVHAIQIALERYYVDYGQYPKMIWGGDQRGWSTEKGVGCRTMWQHEPYDGTNEETAHPPLDPLISLGYLESHPKNPFINTRRDISPILKWTSPPPHSLGDGDPRFGYYGDTMGNTIEDPRYLWSGPDQLTRVKNCFLPEAKRHHIAMVHDRVPISPFYAMGGVPVWCRCTFDSSSLEHGTCPVVTLKIFWPGTFFYRSGGSFLMPENFSDQDRLNPELRTIWDFRYSKIDKYFLGGFGSLRTDGMDVIRLTDIHGRVVVNNLMGHYGGGNYEPNPEYRCVGTPLVSFSSPEVFGGGERGKMPYFPYADPRENYWLYGAPDGFPDGVIIGLMPGGGGC